MPYKNESASKGGHIDIVKNPDVFEFLKSCEYLKEPNEQEAKKLVSDFINIQTDKQLLPDLTVASDASLYANPIIDNFPNTQIGYVKISIMIIKSNEFDGLLSDDSLVDPFKVAKINNSTSISFTLPGSNIKYKGKKSVRDGLRVAIFEQYSDSRSDFTKNGGYTIKDMLFCLNDTMSDKPLLKLVKCPVCDNEINIVFKNEKEHCSFCESELYFTDCLRIDTLVSDFSIGSSHITRFMSLTEHLMLVSIVRFLFDKNKNKLSTMAFVLDGPLAIFGEPARVSLRLMSFYYLVKESMESENLQHPLIIGLQKTGQVVDYANSIARYIPNGSFKVIDDDYRHQHIFASVDKNKNFGHETYYGQDFIYKTNSGRIFIFALPYPFMSKNNDFSKQKIEISRYGSDIQRAISFIENFELDLYENAIIPVALAHKHASVSLVPGGKILDILTKNNL